nr:glycoside hydrolase family protein [Halomicronema sp. CCY15110]
MDSLPPSQRQSRQIVSPAKSKKRGPILGTACLLLTVAWLISTESPLIFGRSLHQLPFVGNVDSVPLAMETGDPYIRALMRTISVAESHTADPYHTLYGGQRINDLTQHPDLCIKIVAGPNTDDCTTAAGRYQFLSTTWLEKARQYHPEPPQWYSWWADYNFGPTYQDAVVYRWLSDFDAWNADIPDLLRQGQVEEVFYLLSGTWTSLGYGTEDNVVTPYLREIYQQMLQEELAAAQ